MYLDDVVLASLLTIAALLAILGYLVYYGYRHLREEEKAAVVQKERVTRRD